MRNAVDNETAEGLADAFRAFEADADAKVAVLWGAGGAFCAGADLKSVASGERLSRYKLEGDGPMGPSRLKLTKPVIAAVAGHAVAGGLELAIWCDLRVAEEDAVFGVYCRRWGVPLIDGGTVRLPHLIGQSRALDMILTGRAVDAAEALSSASPTASCGRARRVPPPRRWRPRSRASRSCACGSTARGYPAVGAAVRARHAIRVRGRRRGGEGRGHGWRRPLRRRQGARRQLRRHLKPRASSHEREVGGAEAAHA